MTPAAARPKYLDALQLQIELMTLQLNKKRTWLIINCGSVRDEMIGIDAAAAALCQAAAAMDKEIHKRRHSKVAPFPAKAES